MSTAADRQLVFELPHRPALGRADFLVAPANEMAVAWIDRWPDWPKPVLLIHGAPGSGKTHLASVWRHATGAVALDGEALLSAEPPALLGGCTTAVLDDLDRVLTQAADHDAVERRLFHVHNLLAERGGHLMVTGRAAPAHWPIRLPDLRSRLLAGPSVMLGPPDDSLLAAVLVKLFADRQLLVEPRAVRYMLPRMDRSFDGARRLVEAVDRAALTRHKDVTIPLVRAVFEGETPPPAAHRDGGSAIDKNDREGEDRHGHGDRR